MQQNAKKVSELLKLLANEHRLMILCVLLESPRTVGAISEKIGHISQSALSQHLALLRAHGVLKSEKRGLNVTYFISDTRVKEIIDVLKVYYCKA